MLRWQAVNSDADPVLPPFLTIYEKSFPVEVLVPPGVIVSMIEKGNCGDGAPNLVHVGAALEDDVVVGGAVFNFLQRSNLGFLNYIFVDTARRGQGIGAFVYHHLRNLLERDAMARNQKQLEGVVLEVEREDLSTAREERPERIQRLRFFGRMGARILEGLDYLQPPLHPGEEPLPMYLMLDPVANREEPLSATRVLSWMENIYEAVYVGESGLDAKIVGECLHRITTSLRAGAVTFRHPI